MSDETVKLVTTVQRISKKYKHMGVLLEPSINPKTGKTQDLEGWHSVASDKVANMIYNSLMPSGYLVIGSKETLDCCGMINKKFRLINEEEKIYKKGIVN